MARSAKGKQDIAFMPFESIHDRETDTRKVRDKHVKALELSILAIGLIEPLVVDQDGVLLAGGHRKAAIASIREDEALFTNVFPDGVPVRVMPFRAEDNQDKALQVEIAENEHRKDYTAKEIKQIAERLKSAGFVELKGRPSKKQKPLMPALSAVVGKSTRQLRRIMSQESRTHDHLSESQVFLRRALANLEKFQKTDGHSKTFNKKVEKMIADINKEMG